LVTEDRRTLKTIARGAVSSAFDTGSLSFLRFPEGPRACLFPNGCAKVRCTTPGEWA
jgi:hypothetical protein